MSSEEAFFHSIDLFNKPRAERKKENFIRMLKEKKGEKRKEKKKIKIAKSNGEESENNNTLTAKPQFLLPPKDEDIDQFLVNEKIEFEYVDEDPEMKPKAYENFKNVFGYFVIPKKEEKENDEEQEDEEDQAENENENGSEDEDNFPIERKNEEGGGKEKLSKKKRKALKRMKISELKQLTSYPEVVEAWDVTAQDARLLIYLKSMKNTVAVPKHWAQKRKFLQNKRGLLKQPFKLPDFIEATGISKIRDTTANERKGLKQKMRERMQPKLGRMDIDYQVLHDAFFKYQTKPELTNHGDVYYENKEFECKMKMFKPGKISDKLRVALGIPENSPPPWIINMQRYGPPPSYPNLKIPGVNAPICDPTADITPNLWKPPNENDKPPLVWDFKKKGVSEHWGDIREIEEDDVSEDLNEDMSISDDEKPEVQNLFSNDAENIGKTGMPQKANLMSTYAALTSGPTNPNQVNMMNAVPNPNANMIFSGYTPQDNKFYSVLEQKNVSVKQGELHPSSFGYAMPGKSESESKQAATAGMNSSNTTVSNAQAGGDKKEKEKEKHKYSSKIF